MTYLLDINLLLALVDPMHVHHEAAHRWFSDRGHRSWATCPLTENGFVRIASHPNYPNRPGDVRAVLSILGRLCAAKAHEFWPDTITILEVLRPNSIITHAQITDVYLSGLAVHNNGRLATLDRRLAVEAVQSGKEAIEFVKA